MATPWGRSRPERSLLAPGAWANRLLAPLGFDFGLLPNRVQITIMRRTADDGPSHPVYIDGPNNAWLRPEGSRHPLRESVAISSTADPDCYDEGVDFDYIVDSRRRCAGGGRR